MLTVICVLKSGGIYDAEWVRRLRDATARQLRRPHRFVCLSDVDVPCERIPLKHDWPSWWSKIELFAPGIITDRTLYLDLDTVLVGEIGISKVDCDFAMLRNFWRPDMVGSGVMWFSGDDTPHHVYEKFTRQPDAYIAHHQRRADGPYVGDQAFIWDAMGHEVAHINNYLPGIKSYKMHCLRRLPPDASIVCFHGKPRPTEVGADWMEQHWGVPMNLQQKEANQWSSNSISTAQK